MNQNNPYTIPVAIVIAGVLIAGALFFTKQGPSEPVKVASNTAGSQQSASAINLKPISNADHILGNPRADIVVVEYSDTECPFCKDFHNTMHRTIDEYGKDGEVAWVYRHFPIAQLHSKAAREAEATECAAELGGNSGFWSYIDRVFEVTPSNNGLSDSELPNIAEAVGLNRTAFEQCLNSGKYAEKVQANFDDARAAGGRGTPYNVIVVKEALGLEVQNFIASAASGLPPRTIVISDDGKKVALNGALPFDFLKLIIDALLGDIPST